MADPNNVNVSGGWTLGGFSQPTDSTDQRPLSPSQVNQIQAQTTQMMQPATPQQGQMMNGLFGGQNGQNLGAVGQALWGSTPAFGGGNILSGDAYGGSAAAPLPGLSPSDYAM